MRAAVLHGPGADLVVEDVVLDGPGPDEVRVRIVAAGVCHSDVMTATGAMPHPLPVVLGHEGAGVVEQVGSEVQRLRPGEHVILHWSPSCGECRLCRLGRSNLCSRYAPRVLGGTLFDGTTRLHTRGGADVFHYSFLSTFAEDAVVPQSCCVPIDKEMPLQQASLIGCCVMTGFGAAVNTARVAPGSTVVVFGAGGVGINAVQGSSIAGADRIIAIDPEQDKRGLSERFGATDFLDPSEVDVVEAVADLTEGYGADIVIEASGNPGAQAAAYAAARRDGTVVYTGVTPVGTMLTLPAPPIPREERTITGSFFGGANPQRDFPMIVSLYRRGRLLLDELVSRVIALDEINDAVNGPTVGIRTVIDMTEERAR